MSRDAGTSFRPDIQGLRAVAVLLVLAYHLWPDSLTGGFVGVDVFFVISGFLITAHLLEHPPRRSRDLLEFWGRRIRRLLPAAFLVLAVTVVASRILAPETRWAANAGEIIASALYVQNWVLAGSSVDYLAAAEAPTPVQHYWSLSVEEQFYLVWPILILAIFWFAEWLAPRADGGHARGDARRDRRLTVHLDHRDGHGASERVLHHPDARLGAGGRRAHRHAAGPRFVAAPRAAVDGAAWIGLAMLLVAGVAYSVETPFPGSAAILPVAGTALVILAAARGPASPTRLLRLRPIQHLGNTSYSIYLWHWPLIVFWPYVTGAIGIGFGDSLLIIAVTIGLATVTKVFVEDPFRFEPSFQPLGPTFRFAAVGMLVVALLGSAQLVEAPAVERGGGELARPGSRAGRKLVDGVFIRVDNRTRFDHRPERDQRAGIDGEYSGSNGRPHVVRGRGRHRPGLRRVPAGPGFEDGARALVAATDNSDAYRDGCWMYAPVRDAQDLPVRKRSDPDRAGRQLACRAMAPDPPGPRQAARLDHTDRRPGTRRSSPPSRAPGPRRSRCTATRGMS